MPANDWTPAGDFIHRISIQSPVKNQNGRGDNLQTWEQVGTVWAAIEPYRGDRIQLTQAFTVTSLSTHKIIIRYNPLLTALCRIGYQGLYYSINYISDPGNQHIEQRILCTRVDA